MDAFGTMGSADKIDGKSKVVAVVDGDPAVRYSLKFSLETEGLHVRACAIAQELLDIIDAETMHCLIVENRLQDMSGLDLIDRLRNLDIRAPVILLASHPNRLLRQQAERRGVTIIEKPLTGNVLTEKLRELIA